MVEFRPTLYHALQAKMVLFYREIPKGEKKNTFLCQTKQKENKILIKILMH